MAAENSAAAPTVGRRFVLVSSDGYEFEVSQAAASLSVVIGNCIRGVSLSGGVRRIRLVNVAGRPLAKVVEYCEMHSGSSTAASEGQRLTRFDAEFIVDVDQAMLYDLVTAADGLDIKGLFDLCCRRIGNMIRGKSPDQIRQTFRINNDFTADEEAEIRRDNGWLFNNQ